jgi:hypothetical protein
MNFAIAKVEAKPFTDPTGVWTTIAIREGRITKDLFGYITTFTFSTVHDHDLVADDYTVFANWLLQRGAYVKVTCTDDGSFVSARAKVEFEGKVWTWSDELVYSESGTQIINYTCHCRLKAASHNGTNSAHATRQLNYETTAVAADFEAGSEFILNIPTPAPYDTYDFVPGGITYLVSCPYTKDGVTKKLHDFGSDQYTYLANKRQIVFHENQADNKAAGNDYIIRRQYYDPTDVSQSVKLAITEHLTGAPFSFDGGLGIDPADIDLDEVVSFDGVSPKLIRSLMVDKHETPVSGLWDEMKDQGLLPFNYNLRDNPRTGHVEGRYVVQDNGSAILLVYVRATQPCTLEGICGLVESYAEASVPINYAVGATVTVTADATFNADYDKVGDEANLADGDGSTFVQFHRLGADVDDPIYASPNDLIVFDLCAEAGDPAYRDIREIYFRASAPKLDIGGGKFKDVRVYYERQQPRVTITGSMTPITSSNPGTPVGDEATNIKLSNLQISPTYDIQATCDKLRRMRYVGIRFEQEGHIRTTLGITGVVHRWGYFGVSEVAILGSQMITYPDGHVDAGRVPYAMITDKGSFVGARVSDTRFTLDSITGYDGTWVVVNQTIQLQHLGTIYTANVDTLNVGTKEITVTWDVAPPAVSINDKVGWRKRWQAGLSGTFWDLYRPLTYLKLMRGGEQSEQITQSQACDLDEAEAQCADRLFEIISISRDYEVEAFYDSDVDAGSTCKIGASQPPWLCTRQDIVLSPRVESMTIPAVTMTIQGTNYEEAAQ